MLRKGGADIVRGGKGGIGMKEGDMEGKLIYSSFSPNIYLLPKTEFYKSFLRNR